MANAVNLEEGGTDARSVASCIEMGTRIHGVKATTRGRGVHMKQLHGLRVSHHSIVHPPNPSSQECYTLAPMQTQLLGHCYVPHVEHRWGVACLSQPCMMSAALCSLSLSIFSPPTTNTTSWIHFTEGQRPTSSVLGSSLGCEQLVCKAWLLDGTLSGPIASLQCSS